MQRNVAGVLGGGRPAQPMFTVIALMGAFALLPMQLIDLPLQMDAVDLWVRWVP